MVKDDRDQKTLKFSRTTTATHLRHWTGLALLDTSAHPLWPRDLGGLLPVCTWARGRAAGAGAFTPSKTLAGPAKWRPRSRPSAHRDRPTGTALGVIPHAVIRQDVLARALRSGLIASAEPAVVDAVRIHRGHASWRRRCKSQ